MTTTDTLAIAGALRIIPGFDAAITRPEYKYASVGHCILDSVFSIGVRYEGVQSVVRRYCEHFELRRFHDHPGLPPVAEQTPVSTLVAQISAVGPDRFATEIVRNRGRTSTTSGILKAEAALHFAEALVAHGVETFQDVMAHVADGDLERDLRAVHGQSSGITTRYFFMLAGSPDFIKPDRMILRFLGTALNREVTTREAEILIADVVNHLRTEGLTVDARSIDSAIWGYQRELAAPTKPARPISVSSRNASGNEDIVTPSSLGGWPRAMAFVQRLDETKTWYRLRLNWSRRTLMFVVHIPAGYCEVEFFEDGTVEVEWFKRDEGVVEADAGWLEDFILSHCI